MNRTTYRMTIDIGDFLEEEYPNLSQDEVDKLARQIYKHFDWGRVYESLCDAAEGLAGYEGIKLEKAEEE